MGSSRNLGVTLNLSIWYFLKLLDDAKKQRNWDFSHASSTYWFQKCFKNTREKKGLQLLTSKSDPPKTLIFSQKSSKIDSVENEALKKVWDGMNVQYFLSSKPKWLVWKIPDVLYLFVNIVSSDIENHVKCVGHLVPYESKHHMFGLQSTGCPVLLSKYTLFAGWDRV